jgi:hypothetical protein
MSKSLGAFPDEALCSTPSQKKEKYQSHKERRENDMSRQYMKSRLRAGGMAQVVA